MHGSEVGQVSVEIEFVCYHGEPSLLERKERITSLHGQENLVWKIIQVRILLLKGQLSWSEYQLA